MTRNGSALFVALIVVLLGALITVLATMVAATEVRAGTAWRDQQVAASLATSAVARSRERADSLFDSLVTGESRALDDTISLTRLGDSTATIAAAAEYRSGQELGSTLLEASKDSLGVVRLLVPRGRARVHPIR